MTGKLSVYGAKSLTDGENMSSSLQLLLSISGMGELVETLSHSKNLKCSLNTGDVSYLSVVHIEGGHLFVWPMKYGDEDIEEYKLRFNLNDDWTYSNWFYLDVNKLDCVIETLNVLSGKFVAGVYMDFELEFSTLVYNDLINALQNNCS